MRRFWGSCACGVRLRGQAQGGNLPVFGSDSQNGVGTSAFVRGFARDGLRRGHTWPLGMTSLKPPATTAMMTMKMVTTITATKMPMLIQATIFAAVLSPPP
jgi:hypothetical protein